MAGTAHNDLPFLGQNRIDIEAIPDADGVPLLPSAKYFSTHREPNETIGGCRDNLFVYDECHQCSSSCASTSVSHSVSVELHSGHSSSIGRVSSSFISARLPIQPHWLQQAWV